MLSYELKDSLQNISEVKLQDLLKQTQCLARLEKSLGVSPGTLPPSWGWTALPDLLEIIAEQALNPEVKNCLECGSGLSTVVTALCLKKKGFGKVVSLEHDLAAKKNTDRELSRLGLEDYAKVIHAPLQEGTFNGKEQPWYSLPNSSEDLSSKIDMLFVDGPPVTTCELARYPALPCFADKLSNKSLVILDDGIRDDEQKISKLWSNEYPELKKEFKFTERQAIIMRKDS